MIWALRLFVSYCTQVETTHPNTYSINKNTESAVPFSDPNPCRSRFAKRVLWQRCCPTVDIKLPDVLYLHVRVFRNRDMETVKISAPAFTPWLNRTWGRSCLPCSPFINKKTAVFSRKIQEILDSEKCGACCQATPLRLCSKKKKKCISNA